MEMKTLLSLFLACSCLAADYGLKSAPVVVSWTPLSVATFSPISIPGLQYWWVAEDNPTNATVQTWADRIQTNNMNQPNASWSPTNSSKGLYFNGSDWYNVTNVSFDFTNNTSYFIVLNANDVDAQRVLFCKDGTGTSLRLYMSDNLIGGPPHVAVWDNLGSGGGGCKIVLGSDYDITCASNPIGTNVWFTNGISAALDYNAYDGNAYYFGMRPAGFNIYQGYIREICIWTNHISTNQVLLLHKYATNKYGVYP